MSEQNKRRWFWGGLEVCLLFCYVIFLQNLYLLLFLALLITAGLTFAGSFLSGRAGTVQMILPQISDGKQPVKGKLIFWHPAIFSGTSYAFRLKLKNQLTLEEDVMILFGESYEKQEEIEFEYIPEHGGCILVELMEVSFFDLFGIISKKADLKKMVQKHTASCHVFPPMLSYEPEEFVKVLSESEPEEYEEWGIGKEPGEMAEIREFEAGDSRKQIHWKLSGKFQTLMVSLPARPVDHTVCLMFDNILPEEEEKNRAEYLEWAVGMFFSISSWLRSRGMTYYACWQDCQLDEPVFYEVGDEEIEFEVWKKLLSAGWKTEGTKIWEVEEKEMFLERGGILLTNQRHEVGRQLRLVLPQGR